MYRYIFIILLSIIFIMPALATREIVTQEPYYNPNIVYSNPYNTRYNLKSNELSALEEYAFNNNFAHENNLQRLCRLEMQTFGSIQQGDFDTRYKNVRTAILSRPKQKQNYTVWKNLANYFIGQTTGYTPPIINTLPQNTFSTFGNSNGIEYANPYHRGYRINNFWGGSGSKISILD